MIIQAGFDLQILAAPLILQEGGVLPRLVTIGLDADMQLDGINIVTEEFTGSLEPHREAVLKGLDPEWVKYFAIAHAGMWPEHSYGYDYPIHMEAQQLKEAGIQRGFRMIGHFGIDETVTCLQDRTPTSTSICWARTCLPQ